MSKVALVVDDSRVARHVLSKLLAEHGIESDAAESAEEALEYLKHRRPDVVFMDHLMPGMDGFEALEAIKANPATATIPVLMYTSQQGELYVGQARALGAFGVLPKELKPTEVQAVLNALHLTPGAPQSPAAATSRPPQERDDQSRRVEDLLQELFHHQRAALREEIRESHQRAVDSVRVPILPEPEPRAESGRNPLPMFAFVAALILAVVLGLLYGNVNRALESERLQTAELSARIAQLATARDMLEGGERQPAPAAGAVSGALLRVLERAVMFDSRYVFGELALSDARAEEIDVLIRDLETAGFAGTVFIDVHAGRFCMNLDELGDWAPAPADLPATECVQHGWPDDEAGGRGERQSIGFANMVAGVERRRQTTIQINSFGHQLPALPYPAITEFVTAGDWNAVAARNQRVELRFQP